MYMYNGLHMSVMTQLLELPPCLYTLYGIINAIHDKSIASRLHRICTLTASYSD